MNLAVVVIDDGLLDTFIFKFLFIPFRNQLFLAMFFWLAVMLRKGPTFQSLSIFLFFILFFTGGLFFQVLFILSYCSQFLLLDLWDLILD